MGSVALLIATLAGSVVAVAWVLGDRPRAVAFGPWRSLVVAVAVPGCLVGSMVLVTTSSHVLGGLAALVAGGAATAGIARMHRSAQRLLRGDVAHADAVVRELRASRPVAGEDAHPWNTRAVAAARALGGGRLHRHVVAVLDLVDWSTLVEEHRASAAGTLGFSQLLQGDVVAARAAVDRAADVAPGEQDVVREMVHLRLLSHEPGADHALDRLPDVEALVQKAPVLRRQALVFRAHACAARGDDAAAIAAARTLADEVGRDVALAMLKVPVGPATALVLEATARGAYR